MSHYKLSALRFFKFLLVTSLVLSSSYSYVYSQADNVDIFIQKLKDDNKDNRREAAIALSKIRDNRATDALIFALKDEDDSVRWWAQEALKNIGTPAVDSLIAALKDKNSLVRSGAAFILGVIKDARAVDPLIIALKDKNAGVRASAAPALGKIGGDRTIEALIIALKDENPDVVNEAVVALGKSKDPRAVEPLLVAFKNRSADWEIVENALLSTGKPAVEPLIDALTNDNTLVNYRIYKALQEITNQNCGRDKDNWLIWLKGRTPENIKKINAIRIVLEDHGHYKMPFQETAHKIIEGAGFQIAREASAKFDASLHIVTKTEALDMFYRGDFYVKSGYVKTGARIEGNISLKSVLGESLYSEKFVGSVSPPILHKVDVDLIKALREGPTKPKDEVPYSKAYWEESGFFSLIVKMISCLWGVERVMDSLISLLEDDSWRIRQSAVWELAKINDQRVIEPLLKTLDDALVQKDAASGLLKLKELLKLEDYFALLKIEDLDFRNNVISAIGETRDSKAVDPLIKILTESDNTRIISTTAVALGNIKDKRAAEPLLKIVLEDRYPEIKEPLSNSIGEILGKDYNFWIEWYRKNVNSILPCENKCMELSKHGQLKQGVTLQECIKTICR